MLQAKLQSKIFRIRVVNTVMDLIPMTQARQNMSRRPHNADESDKEAQHKDCEAVEGIIYAMLGCCAPPMPAVTTQQWLTFRSIEL